MGTVTMSGTCNFESASLNISGDLVVNDTTYAAHAAITVIGGLSIPGESLIADPGGTVIDVGGSITGSAGAVLDMGSGAST